MTGLNKKLAAALIIPLACLALLTVYKAIKIYTGKKVIVPITGFDPRDLLSGHYLTYRLDLDTDACNDYESDGDTAYICLTLNDRDEIEKSSSMTYLSEDWHEYCDVVIRGTCTRGSFSAGIERFYIPEGESVFLDSAVQGGRGSLILSVDRNGKAAIKDLLINGRPWREAVQEEKRKK
ncbi:MAG TPA: GDYXXLXY domain-containing protein [Spirochaetota bacterium]|nr:GDYXXLXY domain-containing protein [Spirochaetota bacterium]HPI87815.1 GDYXXLXY domain-containing protein [Spirochaetota bacterium]HPR47542.1 GDYXXLXY domain-containing protein [Spirochaetota bacterium]